MSLKSKRLIRVIPKATSIDNSYPQEKVAIRKQVYTRLQRELGRPPRVLDLFCGEGLMWRLAYGETEAYLGVDQKPFWDRRQTIQCDNRRLLRHVDFDVNSFDLFDIDAYGSPFEAFAILASRLSWERRQVVGVILTDGTGMTTVRNRLPASLLGFVGYTTRYQERMGDFWKHASGDLTTRALVKCLALARADLALTLHDVKPHRGVSITYAGLILTPGLPQVLGETE